MRSLSLIILLATVGCATTYKDDHRYPVQAIGYDLVTGEEQPNVQKNDVDESAALEKAPVVETLKSVTAASSFSKPSVTVRSADIENKHEEARLDNSTKIYVSEKRYLQARDIVEFKDLSKDLKRGDYTLKKIQIIKTQEGLEQYNDREVYIWDEAF